MNAAVPADVRCKMSDVNYDVTEKTAEAVFLPSCCECRYCKGTVLQHIISNYSGNVETLIHAYVCGFPKQELIKAKFKFWEHVRVPVICEYMEEKEDAFVKVLAERDELQKQVEYYMKKLDEMVNKDARE